MNKLKQKVKIMRINNGNQILNKKMKTNKLKNKMITTIIIKLLIHYKKQMKVILTFLNKSRKDLHKFKN